MSDAKPEALQLAQVKDAQTVLIQDTKGELGALRELLSKFAVKPRPGVEPNKEKRGS
jgi:hypothetical protein